MREEREETAFNMLKGARNYFFGIFIANMIIAGIRSCRESKKIEIPEPVDVRIEETEEVREGDIRAFNPEEHYVKVEIPKTKEGPGELVNYSIPEGYDVYSINPYTKIKEDETTEEGFTICYVNKEPVVVYAIYDAKTNTYGYNTFGSVLYNIKTKQLTK